MRKVIFDLDLTLVDTTVVEQARHDRNWSLAYSLIPNCVVYDGMEKIFDVMREINQVVITGPVSRGDAVILDVLGLGVDVIVTSNMLKERNI